MESSSQRSQAQTTSTRSAAGDTAAQVVGILKEWQIPKEQLADMVQATQRSLDTVTHLTEYEDDKANRILTAMAFLSALEQSYSQSFHRAIRSRCR
ncbi:MAG TPA: hypothetical protein VG675_13070 [Bryobacteraceae bacterium]|nr:hypothetical protein [Bryobacteraceae bacterium]